MIWYFGTKSPTQIHCSVDAENTNGNGDNYNLLSSEILLPLSVWWSEICLTLICHKFWKSFQCFLNYEYANEFHVYDISLWPADWEVSENIPVQKVHT